MIERVDETERRRDDEGAKVPFWAAVYESKVAVSRGCSACPEMENRTEIGRSEKPIS